MKFDWVYGSKIEIKCRHNQILVRANKEGLLSMVNHMKNLSEDQVLGAHFHLDEFNGLENGSMELIIEKTD